MEILVTKIFKFNKSEYSSRILLKTETKPPSYVIKALAIRVNSLAMLIRINPFVRHKFIHDLAFVKFSNFISIHSLPYILCNASVIVFSFLTILFLLSGLLLMLTSVSGGFLFTPPTFCQFQFQLILSCPCGASLVCTLS